MADRTKQIKPTHQDSRLRCVLNASRPVNAVRAEFSGAVQLAKADDLPVLRANWRAERSYKQRVREAPIDRGSNPEAAPDVLVNVFIATSQDDSGSVEQELSSIGGAFTASRGQLHTATLTAAQIRQLDRNKGVVSVELAETLKSPNPLLGEPETEAPARLRQKVVEDDDLRALHHGGEGVLIGIIDVGGFDFAHADFLDDKGETRFVAIWDQGGQVGNSPTGGGAARVLDYGVEITDKEMNEALLEAPRIGVPAARLARQSQMEPSSHATHVASIAAGNGGLCPRAMVAGVLISLPRDDEERRKSFYDTTRVAHAIEYLIGLASRVEAKALAVNISLGTNGGAHDGSSAMSRWIDNAVVEPGRVICVAAGNSGQEAPAYEGDLGNLMGRIHTAGRIPSRGLVRNLDWIVVGDGIEDLSENELEIWYSPQDRFTVQLMAPNGYHFPVVRPGQLIENKQLPGDDAGVSDGTIVSVYNELYQPANGANKISIYLSPYMNAQQRLVIGVTPGRWRVRLIGEEVRDGRYHGWIERDDPMRDPRSGPQAWFFPSFFPEGTNVDDSSVSSLACGPRIISVANLHEAAERINSSSSQGPTRDGRFKPDTAAPGTEIVAANGFVPEVPWVRMTGTSMASPYVTGLVGLMLAVNHDLTAAQVSGIIQRTAQPLPGGTFEWQTDAGFGVITPDECIREADRMKTLTDLTELEPVRATVI